MFKLLIFDLDGTLINSAGDISATVNELLVRRGLPPVSAQQVRTAIGQGLRELVYNFFPNSRGDIAFLVELEKEFLECYNRNLLQTTQVYPGVFEFLENCPSQIAIVTNKNQDPTLRTLKELGLDRFPWVRVYGADALSARKPDPLPLIEAMKAAKVHPHETVMIGDGEADIIAASRAGVKSLAVEYGYADPAELLELGATLTLPSFSELPQRLAQLLQKL